MSMSHGFGGGADMAAELWQQRHNMSAPAGSLEFKLGDATRVERCVLVHVCNDRDRWGAGFVVCVGRAFPEAERAYRAHSGHGLGSVQFVPSTREVVVANLVGQEGLRSSNNPTPIRYDAIRRGLAAVAYYALEHGLPVSMPRIGCGLAGGTWEKVEPIVREELVDRGVAVTVWDL